MKLVPLLDVAPLSSVRVGPFDGSRPYLATGDLSDDGELSPQMVAFENKPSRADLVVAAGDVCFARMAATKKVMQFDERHSDLILSTGFAILRPERAKLDSGYLRHWLNLHSTQSRKDKLCSGATQKAITNEKIADLLIPVPKTLEEQRRIAAILDKANALRAKRREAIAKLDQLLQSMFLNLFGDPITNPKGWLTVPLEEVVFFQEGPGVRNWQFRESGIKLINVINLVDGNLRLENSWRHLDPEEVAEKYSHFLLDVGDLVVASSGVTWGKVAEVSQVHLPLCLNTSVIRLRSVSERLLKSYLRAFVEGAGFRRQIDRLITGSAQPNFGPSHLRKVELQIPPIELQRSYDAFVSRMQEVRRKMTSQSRHAASLFESLQLRAFSGGA